MLAPPVYGMAVKQYAAAMKAVDPTIKIGAVLIGNTEYPDWNAKVLAAACPTFDLAILHWYGGNVGTGLTSLPSRRRAKYPGFLDWCARRSRRRCSAARPTSRSW